MGLEQEEIFAKAHPLAEEKYQPPELLHAHRLGRLADRTHTRWDRWPSLDMPNLVAFPAE